MKTAFELVAEFRRGRALLGPERAASLDCEAVVPYLDG